MADFEAMIREMADAMFAECDANGDGKISMEEAQACAKKYKSDATEEQFQAEWKKFCEADENNDGQVSKEEFIKYAISKQAFQW